LRLLKHRFIPQTPNVFDDADFLTPESTEWPITSAVHQLGTSLGDHPIAEPSISLADISTADDLYENGIY
jgi:hypothetical protein